MRSPGSLLAIAALLVVAAFNAVCAESRPPIIDMHLHAWRADYAGRNPPPMCTPFERLRPWDPGLSLEAQQFSRGPACEQPIPPARTDEQLLRDTIAVMKKRNIIGVVSGAPALVAQWRAAAPDRMLPGVEVLARYEGLMPGDSRLELQWALAARDDIVVGIEMGPNSPADPYADSSGYGTRNRSPRLLEEVLARHPRLRVYVMRAGFPLIADLRAVLVAHPQVYVDLSGIIYTEPRAAFYNFLRELVASGYGARVMFGSDPQVWPGVIEPSIQAIEDAPFLTARQKRDILYNNAARFLRLSPETIAKHHAM